MRENLKNVVLFMASSGYLVPPSQDASKQTLWDETWKRVDRFLPELRSDLASEGLGTRSSTDQVQSEGGDGENEQKETAGQTGEVADVVGGGESDQIK